MARPLIVHRRAGGVDSVLGIASQGLVAAVGRIGLGGGGDVDDVLHATLLHLIEGHDVVDALDAHRGIHPQAGSRMGQLTVIEAALGAFGLQGPQEVDQLFVAAEADVHRGERSVGILTADGGQQIRGIEHTAVFVPDMGAVHAALDHKALLGIQGHTDHVIGEGHVVQLGVAGVGQLELVADRGGSVHHAAELHVLTELGGLLLHVQTGVGDVHIGHDPAVGAVAVTLHVVEVEGTDLALGQSQRVHTLLLRGAQGPIGIRVRLQLSCPLDVGVHVDLGLGDTVSATDIQHELIVDEQIYVIVTFELEEQGVLLIIDELTVGGHHIVVVPVFIGLALFSKGGDTVVAEIIALGVLGVVPLGIRHRQEGEPGGIRLIVIGNGDQVLGTDALQGDGAVTVDRLTVHDLDIGRVDQRGLAVLLVAGIRVVAGAGGVAGVEHIGLTTVVQDGTAEGQVVVIVLDLVIRSALEDIVEQIIGRVHTGGDAPPDIVEGAGQSPGTGQGIGVGTTDGAAALIGALVLTVAEFDTQTQPQGSCQIHGRFHGLRVSVTGQIHPVLQIPVTVDVEGELTGLLALHVVVVVITVGIEGRDHQRFIQQIGNILHRLLPIHGFAILQTALQHTGGHPALRDDLLELIAIEIDVAGIVVALFREAGHILRLEQIHLIGAAGRGIEVPLEVLAVLVDHAGSDVVAITHIIADRVGVIAVGVGVVAAGKVGPAGAVRAEQQTVAQIVAHVPRPPGLQGHGLAAGDTGLDLDALVHIGHCVGAKGIGLGRTGKVPNIGQIKLLTTSRRERDAHILDVDLTIDRCKVDR